jgi:hypothetical protein
LTRTTTVGGSKIRSRGGTLTSPKPKPARPEMAPAAATIRIAMTISVSRVNRLPAGGVW